MASKDQSTMHFVQGFHTENKSPTVMRTVVAILCFFGIMQPGWTQSNWAPAGIPFNVYSIRCLYHDAVDNTLWVGGDIRDGFESWKKVLLKYDGQVWTSYGYFNSTILAITRFQEKIIVAGFFTQYNDTPCQKIAYLEGDEFLPLGTGSDGVIQQLEVMDESLFICGTFSYVDDAQCNMVAVYDGANWYPLEGLPEVVNTDQASTIAKYGGKYWLGGNYDPIAWEETDESDIFFGQDDNWQPAAGGILGSISDVRDIEVYNGELIIGGSIYQSAGNAGNSIQLWNGSEWLELGGSLTGENFSTSQFGPVEDLDVYEDKLFIAGSFVNAGDIYSPYFTVWDGEKYCALGGEFTGYGGGGQLEFYNDTLYIACRDTVDGQFVNNLAKYVGDWEFDLCSSVSLEEQKTNDLHIFPNPANNNIEIQCNEPITKVTVYDGSGHKVQEYLVNSPSFTMKIEPKSSGIYLLRIETSHHDYLRKLIYE